jgi:hypothetical protein
MKFNKWTVALAAIGVVNLTSAARADEKMSQVQTALSNTTLSGYVDVSAQWDLGTQRGGATPQYTPGGGILKSDGFDFNVIDLTLDKPEDESPWASGYHVELNIGPDTVATPRQAYVRLRTPVGNGIDWQVGVWDTIIGYESNSSPLNPNYSHSYGYLIEPTTHTGVLATYKVSDELTVQTGVADGSNATGGTAGVNGRSTIETQKAYMGSVAFTAPDSWGWAKGATMSGGIINADGTGAAPGNTSFYAGATVPTPVAALKFGSSFDYLDIHENGHALDLALYSTYQASDKLSFNARGEYFYDDPTSAALDPLGYGVTLGHSHVGGEELTLDVQYSLWANVLSRVELRWDRVDGKVFDNTTAFTPAHRNAFLLAAQVIYQF